MDLTNNRHLEAWHHQEKVPWRGGMLDPNPLYWCHCGTLVVPFMPSTFGCFRKLTERKWCHDACLDSHLLEQAIATVPPCSRKRSLDSNQMWLTMVSCLWRCSNSKQKSCELERFERIRRTAILPFIPMLVLAICFVAHCRFSLPKAHHLAVWTISLKVRSSVGKVIFQNHDFPSKAPNLWSDSFLFLLSYSKPHRGRIPSMDLAVKLKLRNSWWGTFTSAFYRSLNEPDRLKKENFWKRTLIQTRWPADVSPNGGAWHEPSWQFHYILKLVQTTSNT